MTIKDVSACPKCGGTLKYYDNVRRIIRTKGGNTSWIRVKRYKCENCNKIHRLLPDFIFPYKHYEADIILGVVNGLITSNTLEFEDYPCEMTIKRWTQK